MSIKKSRLEQMWYYRIMKVFLLILPLLAIIVIFWKGYIDISDISQNNILAVVQKNIDQIVYTVIGLVLYFVILKGVWRGFLYIIFGGLEDDTKKINGKTISSVSASDKSTLTPTDKNQIVGWILTLILIACVYYAYFIYKSPQPIHNNGGGKTPTCIPTGCGSLWRCTGSYYSSEVQKRVDGCYSSSSRPSVIYSSWSGTCRQCP